MAVKASLSHTLSSSSATYTGPAGSNQGVAVDTSAVAPHVATQASACECANAGVRRTSSSHPAPPSSSCASSCCAKSCSDTTGPSEQARSLALCAPASSCLKALSMVSWYSLNSSGCCSASGAGPSCRTGSHNGPRSCWPATAAAGCVHLASPLTPWCCALPPPAAADHCRTLGVQECCWQKLSRARAMAGSSR